MATAKEKSMSSEPKDLPTQRFVVSHLYVIRMTDPFSDDQRQKHHHNVEFQLIYVLKGWFKNEFEGEGIHVMK